LAFAVLTRPLHNPEERGPGLVAVHIPANRGLRLVDQVVTAQAENRQEDVNAAALRAVEQHLVRGFISIARGQGSVLVTVGVVVPEGA
jgi:hypothetical protein